MCSLQRFLLSSSLQGAAGEFSAETHSSNTNHTEKLGFTELNEELDAIQNDEKIVGTYVKVLGKFLEKIKNGEIPGLNPEDSDFKRLLARYSRKFEALQKMQETSDHIAHVAAYEINNLNNLVDKGVGGIGIGADLNAMGRSPEYRQDDISYSPEMLKEMKEEKNEKIVQIRKAFFKFISKKDTGEKFSEYLDHKNVKNTFQKEEEGKENNGVRVGYDMSAIVSSLSLLIDTPTENQDNLDGGQLQYELQELSLNSTLLNIIIRDQEVVEGTESNFGELRREKAEEVFSDLIGDKSEFRDELMRKDKDANDTFVGLDDLTLSEVLVLKEKGYDVKKLFLIDSKGQPYDGKGFKVGDTYVLNLGINPELDRYLNPSYLDFDGENLTIDGVLAEFKSDGIHPVGYYKAGTFDPIDVMDGSEIKIASITPAEAKKYKGEEVKKQVEEDLKNMSTDRAQTELYVNSLTEDPNKTLDIDALPKGLLDIILAIIINFIGETKYEYNSETQQYEKVQNTSENNDGNSGGSSTAGNGVGSKPQLKTYGEFRENYEGEAFELGSLSAEYESAQAGPSAYNPNDGGAGPSYGTYQMNTTKGVYHEFIKKHNIEPGRKGWDAKVKELGKATFHKMEHDFIKEKNYDPMMSNITLKGKDSFSPALKNVIWSTAVQHGPSKAKILEVINESECIPGDFGSETKLINAIYDVRGELWKQGKTTRYKNERVKALDMLKMYSDRGKNYKNTREEPSKGLKAYEGRDVTSSIRDLEALEVGFREKVKAWLGDMKADGLHVIVTETLRTQARQNYLYAQGRTRSGEKVTWTKNSNHKTGQAIDIAFDPKFHGELYPKGSGIWDKAGAIAKKHGIDWGMDLWGKDQPHFQDSSLRK